MKGRQIMMNPQFNIKNTYVQIYTGDGKGKTTASLGLTMRHLGQGGSVLYAQFCKGDKPAFPSGEKAFCNAYSFFKGGKFKFINFGSVDKWENTSNITEDDIKIARYNFDHVLKEVHKYSLVVIDEAAHALKCGLITENDITLLFCLCYNMAEVVLTGRDFPESILKHAHLITEMQPTRHYWDIGVIARKGIEY